MKPVTLLKTLTMIATVLMAVNAFAYEDEKKKELCRPPKIQEFTLPVYSESNKKEAPAESEFSFVVSGWANPKKFKLTGKDKDIPFTVKSTETFHKINAKLLPEFTGETVRISVRIPALLECYSTMGWLIKVADKAGTPAAAPTGAASAGATAPNATTPAAAPATTQAAPAAPNAEQVTPPAETNQQPAQ